jgi:hypothetical protein
VRAARAVRNLGERRARERARSAILQGWNRAHQWAKVMGVGDREWASYMGGQTAGSIGAQIGTNTHWNNGQKLLGSAIAGAY